MSDSDCAGDGEFASGDVGGSGIGGAFADFQFTGAGFDAAAVAASASSVGEVMDTTRFEAESPVVSPFMKVYHVPLICTGWAS